MFSNLSSAPIIARNAFQNRAVWYKHEHDLGPTLRERVISQGDSIFYAASDKHIIHRVKVNNRV